MNDNSNNIVDSNNVAPQTNDTVVTNAAPVEPVAPANPAPVEPVAPVNPAPVEPVAPANPAPVEPVAPVNPAPVEPVAPANPAPVEPVAPANPAPVEPVAPANPAPVEPVAPVTTTDNTAGSTSGTVGETKKPFDKKLLIFGIVIVILAVVLVLMLKKGGSSSPSSPAAGTPTSAENVTISGHSCVTIDTSTKCTFSIVDANGQTGEYVLGTTNTEVFAVLSNYAEYVKLDINYSTSGSEKTITDYKLYLKSSNEDISAVQTEAELREKIGLFALGSHTETLTLSLIGTTGVGTKDGNSYNYTEYTFVDTKGIVYVMKYINPASDLTLTQGNQYTVVFEVVNEEFGYEYNISSIS